MIFIKSKLGTLKTKSKNLSKRSSVTKLTPKSCSLNLNIFLINLRKSADLLQALKTVCTAEVKVRQTLLKTSPRKAAIPTQTAKAKAKKAPNLDLELSQPHFLRMTLNRESTIKKSSRKTKFNPQKNNKN